MAGQEHEQGAGGVDGGVEAGVDQVEHQGGALLAGDDAAIGGLEDARAPPARLHAARQGGIHGEGDLLADHLDRGGGARALRAQGVEGGGAPGQHVVPALLGQPHQGAHDGERQHLRQVGDGVETVPSGEVGDQGFGRRLDQAPHLLQGAGPERRAQGFAQGVMGRRVAGDDGAAHAEVGRHVGAGPARRREGLVIAEGGAHVVIAPHGPDAVPRQPDDRASLADLAVGAIGLGDRLLAKEIDVEAGRRAHRRRAQARHWLVHDALP